MSGVHGTKLIDVAFLVEPRVAAWAIHAGELLTCGPRVAATTGAGLHSQFKSGRS